MLSNNKKIRDILEWSKIKVDIQLAKDKPNLHFYIKEVWWASLGSNIGHEEDGKNKKFERPILIIKIFNKHLILIIPLSSKLKENNKFYSKFCLNSEYSSAILSQIRIISSKRLTRKIGRLGSNDFDKIKKKIKIII